MIFYILMSEENIAFRLKFLLQNLGITSSSFADECGISRATFSQLLTGRNKKISDVLIGQIHAAYPALSILWLLFNEGPMWNGQPGNFNPQEEGETDFFNPEESDSPFLDDATGVTNGGMKECVPVKGTSTDMMRENIGFSGANRIDSGSQNLKIPNDGEGTKNYSKENGLNYASESHQRNGIESVNNCIKSGEILSEIEKTVQKTRKVVQVTIYYDDSTFETLFPRS